MWKILSLSVFMMTEVTKLIEPSNYDNITKYQELRKAKSDTI